MNTHTQRSRTHWLFSSYGLLLLLSLFSALGYMLWQAWPSLIIMGMKWQRELYNQFSELLFEAQANNLAASISLIGLSFLYGILHSLGPGHGKVIVSTYIATHPSKVKTSLWITALSALMQAVVAIALVSALRFVLNSSMREISKHADSFVTLSFYAMIVLGIVIIWRSVTALWYLYAHPDYKRGNRRNQSPCSHHHGMDAATLNTVTSRKQTLAVIVSIGIRPCTGAIMVLLFADMIGIYWLGMISAVVMAVGTAFTTSTLAMITISSKKLVQGYLKPHHRSSSQLAGLALQFIGGGALVILGAIMLGSQLPGMSTVL